MPRHRGPRVVSPPSRVRPHCSAMRSSPRLKPSSQVMSAAGRVSARVKPMGVAPMAARSLAATARARWPSRKGSCCRGKWLPATRVSVDTASCSPAGRSSRAQSSPIPRATPSPGCAQRAAAKKRRISSNSPTGSAFAGPQLGAAQLGRQLVEHPVDELVAVGGAEGLGQLDALVDDHPVGHVEALLQLVGGQAQDGQLHRVQIADRPVQAGREQLVDLAAVVQHTVEQLVEVRSIHTHEGVVDAELCLDLVRSLARHVPLVEGLHAQGTRRAARATLRRLGGRLRGVLTVVVVQAHLTSRAASRLTISSAEKAASAPLLPALVPERSMACSMESTVSTPKATGTPYSMDTWARPLVHSPATYSKWGVPPRITAPRAMMAAYSSRWATFWATRGSSKAPGARMMVMSSSRTPWRTRVSTAPLTRLSTTKLLKRPTSRANLPWGATKVPSMVLRVMKRVSFEKEQRRRDPAAPYSIILRRRILQLPGRNRILR